MLVSMLCFSLGLIGLISGIGLLVAAAYNAYVICKHPDYERQLLAADVEQTGPGSADAGAGISTALPRRASRGCHRCDGRFLEKQP